MLANWNSQNSYKIYRWAEGNGSVNVQSKQRRSTTCTVDSVKKIKYEREQTPMNRSAHFLVVMALAESMDTADTCENVIIFFLSKCVFRRGRVSWAS